MTDCFWGGIEVCLCPVCKKMPVANIQLFGPRWRVECKDCEIAAMADMLDTAIDAWNDCALSISKENRKSDDDNNRVN